MNKKVEAFEEIRVETFNIFWDSLSEFIRENKSVRGARTEQFITEANSVD